MAQDDPTDFDALAGETPSPGEDTSARARLMAALGKRLQNPRQISGDAMELLGVVLESSDRAKTEAVKMVAREVRHYLEELKLGEDLLDLATSHSLEVQMSLRLKPLADAVAAAAPSEAETDAPSEADDTDED